MKSSADVIGAMTKAISGLRRNHPAVFRHSQFIAYFNYSDLPTLMAITMADALKAAIRFDLDAFGFRIVVTLLNIVSLPDRQSAISRQSSCRCS